MIMEQIILSVLSTEDVFSDAILNIQKRTVVMDVKVLLFVQH